MQKLALVVSPQSSFGALLRSSLEETGRFRVFIAADEPTALTQLKNENCEMAFLDVDLGMEAVLEIGRALRAARADVELIVISDETLPPALDPLRPWRLLRKPFYLPELLEMLGVDSPEELPVDFEMPVSTPQPPELVWLEDVNKAAQRLTRLTLESSAQAALITRGRKLWAYAGGLSQETANELVRIVSRNWDEQQGGDLLRFARLETTRAEHMLYATTLSEGVALALVFDAETPFGTIRSQASALARSLAVERTGPVPPFTPELIARPRPAPPLTAEEDELEGPSISEILSDIPSPLPARRASLQVEAPVETPLESSLVSKPTTKPIAINPSALETRPSTPLAETRIISRESSPAIRLSDATTDETVKHEIEELDVTAPSKVKRPLTPVRPPQPGELDETKPHSITEVAGRAALDPVSLGLYHLNYACLMVPRFSSHFLTGDVAANLGEWLPQICIAFGWRLEFQAVRPEYVQWVVSVPPNTSPGYLMRIMRQQTSEKIFSDFPRLKRENPSGDFWAPGYLIMGGSQPHPSQLVKDYIKRTRQQQGDSQPRL